MENLVTLSTEGEGGLRFNRGCGFEVTSRISAASRAHPTIHGLDLRGLKLAISDPYPHHLSIIDYPPPNSANWEQPSSWVNVPAPIVVGGAGLGEPSRRDDKAYDYPSDQNRVGEWPRSDVRSKSLRMGPNYPGGTWYAVNTVPCPPRLCWGYLPARPGVMEAIDRRSPLHRMRPMLVVTGVARMPCR